MEEGSEAQFKGDNLYKRLFGEARNYEDSSRSSNFRIALFSGPITQLRLLTITKKFY